LDSAGSSADKDNFDKLKAAYDACLNEDTIKKLGIAPLLDILNETSKHFSSGDLSSAVLHAFKTGQSSLISAGTGADDKDPDTVVVSVSAPWSVGLPAKELYEDEKILKKYEDTISEVFSSLWSHEALQHADTHALVAFEKKIAAATPDAEDRDDVTVS
jgi:endothelin-converting enzyme